jgi:uncharacterized membrane protein
MTIDSSLLPSFLNGLLLVFYGLAMVMALRLAPWRRFHTAGLIHAFLGSVLVLILLWHAQVLVKPGLSFHLMGLTTLTLMFGWSLAVIGASLALVGVCFNTGVGWESFGVNALIGGVVPVTLTQVLLVLIRAYLPRNFFVYVLVNGFLTAGLVGIATGFLVTGLLVATGAYSFMELKQVFVPFFPLMFLPEAIINGWVMTVLVAFRPQWVYSFRDEEYLHGK